MEHATPLARRQTSWHVDDEGETQEVRPGSVSPISAGQRHSFRSLGDTKSYQQANGVRAHALGAHRTASVAVYVAALVEQAWLIEIDAIAAAPG
jgi:hypothetical protein